MAFFVTIYIIIGYIVIKDKGWPRGPPEKPKNGGKKMSWYRIEKKEAEKVVGKSVIEEALKENAEMTGIVMDDPAIVHFAADYETEDHAIRVNYYQKEENVRRLELDCLDWDDYDFTIHEK